MLVYLRIGAPIRELAAGEWKYLSTQHVVMIPGPQDEVQVVRDIFSMYLDEEMSVFQVAEALNKQGVSKSNGSAWNRGHGTFAGFWGIPSMPAARVFARCSKKLRSAQETESA